MSDQPAARDFSERTTQPPGRFAALDGSIGPYRLVERVGEGGMGEVWLAQQTAPVRRQVAVKIIKAGMDTAHVVARFEAERQALAVMDHPAIAKVFDAGATPEGRPYFVMEYVRGEPITTYCNRQRLSTRERLDLFQQVCDGVQHAHQKGIIHRDLKPSNILVSLLDGRPVPKIIDFGIAKAIAQPLTDRPLYTEIGTLIGTPEYMSPEQAEMSGLDIDTRSDVYALGVVLYELLTGALPFDAKALREKDLDEIRRTIREVEPAPPSVRVAEAARTEWSHADPSTLARELRGDLDWITMRALEKDRTRRYGSIAELGADVQRHLSHLPVIAGPPSTAYRMRKFARRHRVGVTVALTLLAMLVAFATTTAIQARRIARERDRANQEAAIAKAVNEFLQNDLLSQASANQQARPDVKPDPDLKVRTALERAAQRIEGKFEQQPVLEASIRHTIGITYYELGLYVDGQRQLERALDLRNRVLGESRSDTLNTASALALLYRRQGKHAQAEPLLTKILQISRQLRGETHRDTLDIMDTLAGLYQEQGKYAQAEPIYTNVLEMSRRVLGDEHPDTLRSMNNLAVLYQAEGKYSQTEALLTKAVEIRRRILGNEHPETLTAMHNLASPYYLQGHYAEAESLLTKVTEVRRRVLGQEHPNTLQSMNNLAMTFRAAGKYAEAEPLFMRVLEIRGRVLGEEHAETLRSMNNLALLYTDERKYVAGEAFYIKVLDLRRRVLGEEHPDTLVTRDNLAWLYYRQARYSEAEALFVRVLDARRRLLGEAHPQALSTFTSLGSSQLQQHKYGEAELTLRDALRRYERSTTDTWERYNCESMLGASLAGQRKYTEAEPLLISGYEGLVQRKVTIPSERQIDVVEAGNRIVQLYREWGNTERAAEWKQRLQVGLSNEPVTRASRFSSTNR